jgi:hypothetical protein
MRHVVIVLLALTAVACAPPPRPFEHNGASLSYRPQQDEAEVAIGTPANMPTELAGRVAAAVAIELQAYGVLAAVQPAPAPLKLAGTMSTRDATHGTGIEIEIEWVLLGRDRDAQGPAVSKTVAQARDYAEASDRLVSRIAQQAAPRIAILMGRPPHFEARAPGQVAAGVTVPEAAAPEALPQTAASTNGAAQPATQPPLPPPPPQIKVMVAPVTGAPSDGNRQLFSGMRRALGSSKLVVADKAGTDVFTVTGRVTLTPIDDRSATLDVKWVLKDPSGREIGSVDQSNPVPLAATRGSWLGFGDIVAAAASEGLLELLEKALQTGR